jgi:hypothetical protein
MSESLYLLPSRISLSLSQFLVESIRKLLASVLSRCSERTIGGKCFASQEYMQYQQADGGGSHVGVDPYARCLGLRSLAHHIFHFTHQIIDIALLYLLFELCVFHNSEAWPYFTVREPRIQPSERTN